MHSLQLQDTAHRLEHTSVLGKHRKVLVELPTALQSQRQGSQGSHSTSRSSLTKKTNAGLTETCSATGTSRHKHHSTEEIELL